MGKTVAIRLSTATLPRITSRIIAAITLTSSAYMDMCMFSDR